MSWLGADPAQECEALIRRLRNARADAQIALADAEHRADRAAEEELAARATVDLTRIEVRDLTREIDDVLEELHSLIPKQHRPAE